MNIELCRVEEVADALGIKVDTLYRYARKGRIRGIKVGKAWRFLQADIRDFLQQHEYHVKPVMRDKVNNLRKKLRGIIRTPAKSQKAGASSVESNPMGIKPSLLPDILRRAALECGVRPAIACGGAQASFADLDKASNQLADSLLSRGVVPGDRVMILLSNSLEFVAACFAVWKAGGIVVAEDPCLHDTRLRSVLRDCAPQALIVDRAVAESLDARRHGLENLRIVYVKGQTFQLPGLDGMRVESLDTTLENKTSPVLLRFNSASPDDVETLTYTGADGGRVMGVMNTHKNWLAGAAFTAEYLALTKQDTLILPVPLHQSLALRQALAYALAGARIILASNLDQSKALKGWRPTALALRPGQVRPLLEKSPRVLKELAGSLRYVEIGSGSLDDASMESLRRLLPRTLVHLSCNLTEAQSCFLGPGSNGTPNGSCRVAPTLALRVVDEHGRPATPGQAGRIQLKGPGLMKGFWGQSEYEMAALGMNGYSSGERAMTDKSGGVILLGRAEETLDIRGRKVNPAVIEDVLRRHAGVAECAVTGLLGVNGSPDTALHAFVAPTARGALLTEPDLKAYCRAFLQPHEVPARIHFHESLPKSADGRVMRETLKAAVQAVATGELERVKSGIPEFPARPS